MGVLVGVEVRDGDAVVLEFLNLGGAFAGDVGFGDAVEEEIANEVGELRAEGFAVGAEERGDGVGWGDWRAVSEDDVAADAEGRVRVGDGYGVVEGGAAGHEGGGGEGAEGVEFGDGAVDAAGEAEVVCIEDEAWGHG